MYYTMPGDWYSVSLQEVLKIRVSSVSRQPVNPCNLLLSLSRAHGCDQRHRKICISQGRKKQTVALHWSSLRREPGHRASGYKHKGRAPRVIHTYACTHTYNHHNQKSRYYCSHLMDGETETCKAQEACPVSQTVFEAELTFATST